MIKCKCIDREKSKSGNITRYMLVDTKGNQVIMCAKDLKDNIKKKSLDVVNLTLTDDNRLIVVEDKKDNSKSKYRIGSKITKALKGFGDYTFTCVEENEKEYWFICDEIVNEQVFNVGARKGNNYATSGLKTYVDGLGVDGLTIPTKKQLEKWYSSASERIAQYNGTNADYWTSSAYPYRTSNAYAVGSYGIFNYGSVYDTLGVRPCFAIKK